MIIRRYLCLMFNVNTYTYDRKHNIDLNNIDMKVGNGKPCILQTPCAKSVHTLRKHVGKLLVKKRRGRKFGEQFQYHLSKQN